MTDFDDDWPEVVRNLWKARKRWACLSIILKRGGGESKGVRDVFQYGGSGSTHFCVGDVGDDPHMGR